MKEFLLRRGADGGSLIVEGMAGVPPASVPELPEVALERLLLVRGEGPAIEGEFRVPESWRPGEPAVWLEGGFRVVRADFDAGASLAVAPAPEDDTNAAEGLALACQGGGSSYLHLAGRLDSDKLGYLEAADSPFHWCLGAWNRLSVGPSENGDALVLTLEKEEDSDAASDRSLTVRIGHRPQPGQLLRWRWVPLPQRSGMEVKDRHAVLALDWAGDGSPGAGGFALSDEIKRTVRLGLDMEQAALAGDRSRYEAIQEDLRKLCPLPRSATPSGQERNGLAAYFLEEARAVLLEETGQGQVLTQNEPGDKDG